MAFFKKKEKQKKKQGSSGKDVVIGNTLEHKSEKFRRLTRLFYIVIPQYAVDNKFLPKLPLNCPKSGKEKVTSAILKNKKWFIQAVSYREFES